MQQSPSVHHRFPVEILELIFLYAVPVSPYCRAWDLDTQWSDSHPFLTYPPPLLATDSRYSFGNLSQSPWSVSQVCKKWRAISLSKPELWSYIGELCVSEKRHMVHEAEQTIVKRLELALDRSKDKGLSLVISSIRTRRLRILGLFGFWLPNAVFRLLIRHTDRWENLCSADVDFPWAEVVPNSRQHQGRLALYNTSSRLKALAGYRLATLVPSNSIAPNLKTICRVFGSSNTFRIGAGEELQAKETARHYCALSSLSVLAEPTRADQGLKLLGQMSHLTNFRLILDDRMPRDVLYTEGIVHLTLPNLDTLCLCMSRDETVEQALNMISAPALQRLQISHLNNPSPLISHIGRSSCPLLSLCINKAHLDSREILEILTRLSNIEDLHICFDTTSVYEGKRIGIMDKSLLQILLDPSKAICRQLKTLTFLHTRDLNLPMIFDMLSMQLSSEPQGGLGVFHRKITIKTDDYIENMISAQHKALVQGLRRQKKLSVELNGASQWIA